MKILMLTPKVPPKTGGGISPWRLAKTLVKHGHSVAMLKGINTEHDVGTELDELKIYSLVNTNHPLQTTNPYSLSGHWFNGIEYVEKKLKDVLEDFNPDIIHIHHFMGQSYKILSLANDKQIPIVMTFHDYRLFCYRGVPSLIEQQTLCLDSIDGQNCAECIITQWFQNSSFARKHKRLIERYIQYDRKQLINVILPKVDRFISPSKYCKSRYVKDLPMIDQFIEVVNLGLLSDLQPSLNKKKSKPRKFGYLGGKSDLKGYDLLIDILKQTCNEFELHFWDKDQHLFEELVQNINIKVCYHKPFDEGDSKEVFELVDILLVPSLLEVYPLVCLESLLNNTPVVAFNVGGIPEIISHQENGYLIEPYDLSMFSSFIDEISDDKTIYNNLKTGAEQTEIKKSEEECIDVLKIYNEVIKAKKIKNKNTEQPDSIPDEMLNNPIFVDIFKLKEESATDFINQYNEASKQERNGHFQVAIEKFLKLKDNLPFINFNDYIKLRSGILYHLGFNHRKQGQINEALQFIDECIKMCHVHKKALLLKKNIEKELRAFEVDKSMSQT